MDNKTAISILNRHNHSGGWQFHCAKCACNCKFCEIGIALDLAIKALEEKPFEINVFLENADESTLFDIKKELARILTERAEREAYEEARREAMKLDEADGTLKGRGYA